MSSFKGISLVEWGMFLNKEAGALHLPAQGYTPYGAAFCSLYYIFDNYLKPFKISGRFRCEALSIFTLHMGCKEPRKTVTLGSQITESVSVNSL